MRLRHNTGVMCSPGICAQVVNSVELYRKEVQQYCLFYRSIFALLQGEAAFNVTDVYITFALSSKFKIRSGVC